jgi:hypothetical protein
LITSSYSKPQVGFAPHLKEDSNTWRENNLPHIDILRRKDNDPDIIVVDGSGPDGYQLGIYTVSDRTENFGRLPAPSNTPISDYSFGDWKQVGFDHETIKVEPISNVISADLDEIINQVRRYYRFLG